MKYPINKEFSPCSRFAPPIQNAKMAGWMGSMMKPPRWIWKDREISVTKEIVKSYDGIGVEVLIFDPCGARREPMPCLVYYHGGDGQEKNRVYE